MYSVSDEFEKAVMGNDRVMQCRINIGDMDIEVGNIKRLNISQSICTSDFEIGTVNAAQLDAEIVNFNGEYTGVSFKNYTAKVYLAVQLADGNEEEVPLGTFKIETSEEENKVISIKGYDAVTKTETDYIPADIYPTTLRQIAADIAATCELELAQETFINENLEIESMPEWGNITCRTALEYAAEAAGGCWIADRSGKLKLVTYGVPEYELKPNVYYTLRLAEGNFAGINSLYINSNNKELAWSVNGLEEYSINNNPLLYDKQTAGDALPGIKSALSHTNYRPLEMDYICNPALDVGDGLVVYDIDGTAYNSVICAKTISFDGGLRGTLSAYADASISKRGSQNQSYGEQIKEAQKTADTAKATADTAQKTADEAKAAIDNLPEIGADIVNTNVIKTDTMQSIWCFSRYMLVQFMETNFDALDATKTYKRLRKYIRIYDDNIKIIEAELSADETEDYKDPNGQKLYWTAVTGANAHKFFTYTSPLTIAKDERPEGLTDAEFEALYAVKVRKTMAEYIKASLGFPLNSEGTGEPELVFGTGDGSGNGKYYFVKDADSGRFVYKSRIDGKEYGIAIKDDAPYLVTGGQLTQMYPIAIRSDISDVSNLPVGTIIFQGNIGG